MKKKSIESKMEKGFAEVKELIESLAIMTFKEFAKVDQRFQAAENNLNEFKEDVGRQFRGVDQRFETVEFIIKEFKEETSVRFDEIEVILEDHGQRLDSIEERVTRFEKDTASNFKTVHYEIKGIKKTFLPRVEFEAYVLKNAVA